ncbi:hypothetical protein GCM10025884_09190 [Leuconostoc gelidum subsp. gelidum]|nr:hypothetical protein GCM10025884_09190 [Leuconostoc gelidum subsp. gelidum]
MLNAAINTLDNDALYLCCAKYKAFETEHILKFKEFIVKRTLKSVLS